MIQVRTENEQISDQLRYLHQDALGSVDTVTDSNGEVVQRSQFEAFGKRTTTGNGGVWTKRGFTGHEHLDSLGLIQMNARLYDPEIGRFLSPDTFIQAATLSQNYNRYIYVLNNPLKYTDPSGHFFKSIFRAIGKFIGNVVKAVTGIIRRVVNVVKKVIKTVKKYAATIVTIAVAAAVTVYTGGLGMVAWKAGAIAGAAGGFAGGLASGGGLKAAIKGAIFGGLSGAAAGWVAHGTGIAAKGAVGIFGDGALKEVAHGITQGTIAQLRSGDFKSGFIGAIVGGAANKIAKGINIGIQGATIGARAARTAIAGVTGGIAAKITGGRFADGAVSAAFTWLFNHEFAEQWRVEIQEESSKIESLSLEELEQWRSWKIQQGKDEIILLGVALSGIGMGAGAAAGVLMLRGGSVYVIGKLSGISTYTGFVGNGITMATSPTISDPFTVSAGVRSTMDVITLPLRYDPRFSTFISAYEAGTTMHDGLYLTGSVHSFANAERVSNPIQ